jgi:hypothetical protein
MAAQAGASLRDGLRDVQIIVDFGYTFFHDMTVLSFPGRAGLFSAHGDTAPDARNSPYYLLYNLLLRKSSIICVFDGEKSVLYRSPRE